MRPRTLARISLILAGLAAAVGCSHPPVIVLSNQSAQTLSNVVISGTGFSEGIPVLHAGETRSVRVQPGGESAVRIVFDAAAGHVDPGPLGYIEPRGRQRVTATIGTNLGVSVAEKPRGY